MHFTNGKYSNGFIGDKFFIKGKESQKNGYVDGLFYDNGKLAQKWYDDKVTGWYYFVNGKKHNGYAVDGNGNMHFTNGKYTNGYHKNLFYDNGRLAQKWYDDKVSDWYYFVDGKKHNGYAVDGNGNMHFTNGKYSNGVIDNKQFADGKEVVFSEGKKSKNKVVFIDPGHGGIDPGASYYGVNEKELALEIYFDLKDKLIADGYIVKSSRESDIYVDYKTERSEIANKSGADIFISLHFNASGRGVGPQGIETYIYRVEKEYPPKINHQFHNDPTRMAYSEKLAKFVHNHLIRETKQVDRGIRRESFAVLRETILPAILIEMGYLDNPIDRELVQTSEYKKALVEGIRKGIHDFYNN